MVNSSIKDRLNNFISKTNTYQALFAFLIFFVLGSLFVPRFLSLENQINVFRQGALICSFSLGMAITMLLAGLDLSIGSVAALSTVLAATAIRAGNVFLGLVIGLGVGLLCGLISGGIIARFRLPPFIMTFGMMKIANGLALNYTKGESIYGFPDSFRWIGFGSVGIVPVPLIISMVLLLVLHFFTFRTVTGHSIYAVGDNKSAARFSGIPTQKILAVGYAISGLLSGLAGIIYIARLGSAQGDMGADWPLQAIAACVLGGVSFAGGLGSILGTAFGALSVAIIYNILNLLGVSPSWQKFVIGFVIVTVIAFDFVRENINERRSVSKNLKKLASKSNQ